MDIEDVDAIDTIHEYTLSGKFVFVGDDKWTLKDGHLKEFYWDKDGLRIHSPRRN